MFFAFRSSSRILPKISSFTDVTGGDVSKEEACDYRRQESTMRGSNLNHRIVSMGNSSLEKMPLL